MLDYETGKRMLMHFLETIQDISDKEYQRKAWIFGIPPGTDFDETVCCFFDMGDPVLNHYTNLDITESQYQILKQFRDQFEAFADADDRPYLPEEFIDTPEWDEITKMAKEVLQAFHYGSDKSEGAAQP